MATKTRRSSGAVRTLDQAADALQAAVADLVRVYQFRDRDQICCHDVSVTQCHALEVLAAHGAMRLNALADHLFLDKSTASRVVQALVRKGYVKQHVEAKDRRAAALTVTRAGRELCACIAGEMVAQQKDVLAGFEPEVRDGVIEAIRRLTRAADARFRGGDRAATCCAPGGDAACGCS